MTQYIYHPETDTFFRADECLFLFVSDDGGGYEFHDEMVAEAFESGTPLTDQLSKNVMSFSPLALREEAMSKLDSTSPDDVSDEARAIRWCAKEATEDQLNAIGEWILTDNDPLWSAWQVGFTDGIVHGFGEYGDF